METTRDPRTHRINGRPPVSDFERANIVRTEQISCAQNNYRAHGIAKVYYRPAMFGIIVRRDTRARCVPLC
jgi:hypothetical protein